MRENQRQMTAARPADLKLNNRRQILELFKSGSMLSVGGIAREVGISRQTVMKAVQFYLEKGIVVSAGKAASGSMGGKRAELYRLSADLLLFNVLICPDYLYVALFSFGGDVLDSREYPNIAELGIDAIIERAGNICHEILQKLGISIASIRGVCVTMPGIVDRETNRLRYNSLFPAWGKDVPIAEKLSAYFENGTLILTENVAKVCGSSYRHDERCARGRVATVFSGWGGIAACMMKRGHIMNGKGALIGEIGHMTLDPTDDEVCGCGCRGCFERQVSRERIQRRIREARAEYPDSTLFNGPVEALTLRDVFDASRAGDALARSLSEYAGRCFAQALRNLTLTFNPDWVIFQGDYSAADLTFRQTMHQELMRFRYYDISKGENCPFALTMDERSIQSLSTLGAYTLLIDRLFDDNAVYL